MAEGIKVGTALDVGLEVGVDSGVYTDAVGLSVRGRGVTVGVLR